MTTSMTYLCCDLLGHDVSDHHLLNLLHLQSHILPHHVTPLSKRINSSLYCWGSPRSSTAPSPTAAWPPGICYNVNIVIGFSVSQFMLFDGDWFKQSAVDSGSESGSNTSNFLVITFKITVRYCLVTHSWFTWEDWRGEKSSSSCEGNLGRPRRGWIWLALISCWPV